MSNLIYSKARAIKENNKHGHYFKLKVLMAWSLFLVEFFTGEYLEFYEGMF